MVKKSKSILIGIISFIIMVLADRLTKYLVVMKLKDHDPVILIRNVFQLYYLENRGAAFGILQGKRAAFILITIIILAIVIYCYVRIPYVTKFRWIRIVLVMIASGAVGNFIDRTSQGYVVDFFYFSLINFPIFNVADIFVTGGAIVLIVVVLFKYKDADLTELTGSLRIHKRKTDTKEK